MPDLRCYSDLDPFAAECEDALEELAQDLYHRLIEAPGSNPDDPDRGLGIDSYLSGTIDSSIKHRIEAELRKDVRVSTCAATISQIDDNGIRIEIEIVADEDEIQLVLVADASGQVRRVF